MGNVAKLPPRSKNSVSATGQRYVRVTNTDARGFVEFQFSIGDPNLYLEMTLPRAAFDDFCRVENAQRLTQAQARMVDETELKWRYGQDIDDA